jgi:hypothetical protein
MSPASEEVGDQATELGRVPIWAQCPQRLKT